MGDHVARALHLLVNASRTDPVLRQAVAKVEAEVELNQRHITALQEETVRREIRLKEAEVEVERLAARELNALRLLLMVQHGWPWPQVCDIGIDDARIMTRTNAPLPTEGDEDE